jgi:hypothetical protein
VYPLLAVLYILSAISIVRPSKSTYQNILSFVPVLECSTSTAVALIDHNCVCVSIAHIRPIISIPLDVNFILIQNADMVCHRKHSNAHIVTYYFPCSLTIKKLKKMDPPRVSSDVYYTGFRLSTLQPISRDIRFGGVVIK